MRPRGRATASAVPTEEAPNPARPRAPSRQPEPAVRAPFLGEFHAEQARCAGPVLVDHRGHQFDRHRRQDQTLGPQPAGGVLGHERDAGTASGGRTTKDSAMTGEELPMADLDDISPDEIPSVSDDPHPTDQPVANPQAVAQEDEDNPRPSG